MSPRLDPIVIVVPFGPETADPPEYRASLAVGGRIVHVIGWNERECREEAEKYAGRVSPNFAALVRYRFRGPSSRGMYG